MLNANTQPTSQHPIFNNWAVIAEGWYFAVASNDLQAGSVKTVKIGSQHLVVYRGQSGQVHAVDGYCPHMGVDLGLAKVIDDNLRCHFHHWQFNQRGQCVDIPCKENPPSNVKLQSYAVVEKYGVVWVWPNVEADCAMLEIPSLENSELSVMIGKPYQRSCHHHITMINGIDAQHLNTIHHLDVEMAADIQQNSAGLLAITLSGFIKANSTRGQFLKWLLGGRYCYQMHYAHGTLGALTMMKDVTLFSHYRMPELHMIYAYTPQKNQTTKITPIYITKKRAGVIGKIKSYCLLRITKKLFHFLKEEDGGIYENIRFNTSSFLKIDKPVAKYVSFINTLKPSIWSTQK